MKDEIGPSNSSPGESAEATPEVSPGERESSFSRRALLHAGWTVPVILTVAPPRAFAQVSPGNHTDGVVHSDTHGDHTDAHSDRG